MQYHTLIDFFEAEPVEEPLPLPEVGRFVTFRAAGNDLQLVLRYAVATQIADLHLKYKSERIYELPAVQVSAMSRSNFMGSELLKLSLGAAGELWLRLRPMIGVAHVAGETINSPFPLVK